MVNNTLQTRVSIPVNNLKEQEETSLPEPDNTRTWYGAKGDTAWDLLILQAQEAALAYV